MFYYLDGTLVHVEGHLAVVDVGGVGFACNTSLNTLAAAEVGRPVKLYTYTYIRDGVFDLYGFATPEERRFFEMLISISGVGPKAAVSILSSATPEQLAMILVTGDERSLTMAPGIGKKIAQRILLELKDKLQKSELEAASGGGGIAVPATASAEVMAALAALGYSQAEAGAALRGVDTESLPVEEAIRLALKNMVRGG